MLRQYLTALGWVDYLASSTLHPLATGAEAPPASLYLNPAKTFQTLEGFGGAFTEAAAVTWQQLNHLYQ